MQHKNAPEVVSLGIVVADVIGHPIDNFPARGALQLVPSIAVTIGGCAANTGIGLQKLGIETHVVAAVGRDGFGDLIQSTLARHGVKAHLARKDEPTSATMVLVASDSERSFLHCVGANASFSLQDVNFGLLAGARLLHIAGHGLMPGFDGEQCAQLLQSVRAQGVTTALDTAGAPDEKWRESLRLCLPHLDFFVPSLHEVRDLFPGQDDPEILAEKLLSAGVKTVALKLGERGSFVTNGHESHFVPSFEVDARDATGAGDGFAAGFLAGVLRGLDLKECARLGNACGALVVTQVGTVAGYRSWEDTLKFMSSANANHSTQAPTGEQELFER